MRETAHFYPKLENSEFMGLLTCKIFNLYFFIQCRTYNSHLHTTLSLKCESINSSCSPLSGSFYLFVLSLLVSLQMDRHAYTVIAAFYARTSCLGRTLRRIGLWYPYWVMRGARGTRPHRGQNNHTSERDATLLPRTLRQWVFGSSHL